MDEKGKTIAIGKQKTGVSQKITCYGCSLFCDDIYVELDSDGTIIKTINSCFKGNEFLKQVENERRLQEPQKREMGLTMNLSAMESIKILEENIKSAKNITFYGFDVLSYNDQISVFLLVKKLLASGKKVRLGNKPVIYSNGFNQGLNLTSVGQAINNADTFIFWNSDPTHSHPKLTGKIVFSRGMFRSTGKEVKHLILVENAESDLTKVKDIAIPYNPDDPRQLISRLDKFLSSANGKPREFEGLNALEMSELNNQIKSTEYGIIVMTIPIDEEESKLWIQILSELQKTLNKYVKGRFMVMPLFHTPNMVGYSTVLYTMLNHHELDALLDEKDDMEPSDLALIFGGDYLRDEYSKYEYTFPERNRILFDNLPSKISKRCICTIPYQIPGIELNDEAMRFDGLNIDLVKWKKPPKEVYSISKIFNELEKMI